jgi:uncharacterized protein YjfI (DUF2170 family)
MISTHLHMTSTGAAGDEAVQKHNIEAKQEVLHTMMAALNTAWTKTRALPVDLEEQDKQLLTEAYVLFANAFRDYCSHYVHSCRDMRVMPMSHVDIGDATHRSAADYVSAYMHGDGASAADNKDLPYSNVLRKWLYYIMSPELSGNYTTSPVLSGWDVESPAPELTRDETTLPDLYCTPDYSPEEPDEA